MMDKLGRRRGGALLLDMQICWANFILHTADCLTAEDRAAEQAQCRIREIFAGRWAFPTVRFFHEDVKILWQAYELKWCWVG